MSRGFSRRLFLQAAGSLGAGLVIGCHVPPSEVPDEPPVKTPDPPAPAGEPKADPTPLEPNAWVRIGPDGVVTVIVDRAEMGQGIETALVTLVAEELEVDPHAVKTSFAPVNPAYKNALFGLQATGGSTSVRAAWEPLRKAGAAARMMLVGAAARTWKVEESSCTAEDGEVIHAPTGKRLGYGALVAEAANSPVPKDPPLKPASAQKRIGKRVPRLDAADKATGRTVFGIDAKRPDMLVAMVARCPVFGGKVAKFDAARSQGIKGVKKVFAIDTGVAVVATGFWQARKAIEALDITWDEGPNATNSSEKIAKEAAALAKKPGKVARKTGDAERALKTAAQKIEAVVYEAPFQAHAAMEPLSCTIEVRDDSATLWVHTQFPEGAQKAAAGVLGLPPSAVAINTLFLGGGFGRKFEADYVLEAAQIGKEMRGTPIKVVWSREDDIRHDYYRPATYNVLRGGVGKDTVPLAWSHRVVGPSIMSRVFPQFVRGGLDHSSLEGAEDLPYAVPNLLVDYHLQETNVPVGFWRSVGHSQNAFITECFFDELAALGKQDPFELRRKLLAGAPRLKAALELAAEKAGWSKPLPAGMGRGIACHVSFGSYVAQVAEVSVDEGGRVKVHRVVCAIDCGSIVNPDTIEAQIEGGIVYGLTAALKGSITIENGRVKQGNFHNFRLLTIAEMPAIEVHIVPSQEPPGGVGEPGTPPIAPAVVNAVFAATGKRLRRLPIRPEDLKKSG